ncbi:MAG: entericidin A/B family lipoprotein [Pseudomonadota bacterium]
MTASLKRTFVLAAASIVALVGLSACETIKGIGRDIENTGEAIEGAVN